MTLALIAAIAGMLIYGVGSILQAVGAQRAHGPAVVKQPIYIMGLAADGLAWLASLVALAQLPLFVVQSILAGSLGVTVILARAFLGTRVRQRDAIAIAVVVIALVVIALSAGKESARPTTLGTELAILAGFVITLIAAIVLYRRSGSIAIAVVSGLGFSGAALCARAVHIKGWETALREPLVWALIGFGIIGALAYARSLEGGAVGPVTAVMWAVEVVVPGIIGIVALGDTVRDGWAIPAVLAVVATVGACIALANSPAQNLEVTT